MNGQKTIICVQSLVKYKNFLDIIEEKYDNICLVENLTALKMELLDNSAKFNVLFLDYAFLKEITEDLASVLEQNQYICVILSDKADNELQWASFVYDVLPCDYMTTIHNFFIRFSKDFNCRLQLEYARNEVRSLYDIGKKLSSEKDIKVLLELIINSCMELSSSDAATIYIVVDSQTNEWSTYERSEKNRVLKFVIAKNNSIEIDIESNVAQISESSIVGYTVISGFPLRIDDAYGIPGSAGYRFNEGFDKRLGYRTKSILTVPMKDHRNRILGVIQLINKKTQGEIFSFTKEDEALIFSLAGQAAVTLENNILYKNMENLLEQYRLVLNEEVAKRQQADEEIYKLLSAVEHSPAAVMITDATGHIQYVNPKFTQLTGYSFKEAAGKTPGFLKSGCYSSDFYKEFWNTVLSGKEWYGDFYNRKKNGEFYWESTSVSSLKDENSSIKYFIAVREDITEKKRISRSLEEKNTELQNALENLHKVQSQLIQKEKMASIGQLAAGIAHEINNPLGFVMSDFDTLQGYAKKIKVLLSKYEDFAGRCINLPKNDLRVEINSVHDYKVQNKMDWVIDDLNELLKDSNDGLDRVKKIVNALRMFAGIDQFNEISDYDLNAGIKTTLQIIRNKIKDYADIHEEYNPLPEIMAAGVEINQVILNLILNAEYAVKVNQNIRTGIIHLKTYHDDNDVYFEITDNGIGIEEEQINRIFEPFYTTKPVGEGTGLGLSLSYDIIVKKYKGDISVTSKPGVGTRFTVKLPVMQNKS